MWYFFVFMGGVFVGYLIGMSAVYFFNRKVALEQWHCTCADLDINKPILPLPLQDDGVEYHWDERSENFDTDRILDQRKKDERDDWH